MKRKLRAWVLPCCYVLVIGVLFISIAFLGSTLQDTNVDTDLTVSTIVEDEVIPVISTEDEDTDVEGVVRPYISESVEISKNYYDMNDTEEVQEGSLIYYENTYMPSTGVLYVSSEEFDIVSVYDGTVTNVSEDDILGKYVEITHNTNLRTVYYSLSEVTVSINDTITTGDILGKSGECQISEGNTLLFEVYYNGFAIDPEEFYTMDINELV